MGYTSEAVIRIVNQMNHSLFLPAIQREFVWKPAQVIQLFDSLLRNYPISSFLFWEVDASVAKKFDVYKFIVQNKPGVSHNENARVDGIKNLRLVLDGQQRLTSLLIGLKGYFFFKKKYKRRENPDSWTRMELYLDLLKDPDEIGPESDYEFGVRFGFKFLERQPKSTRDSYMFKVGNILNFSKEKDFENFLDEELEKLKNENLLRSQLRSFEKNIERLYKAIWKDDAVAYYVETDQDYDKVLDIFVRANEGGTKLSKSDLLLSMMTSTWADFNAREQIYGLVDFLNSQLHHQNDFSKDFVMKSCLALSDLPIQYKVENFIGDNLKIIQTLWPEIKTTLIEGIKIVNRLGIDANNLTSVNALIPILYYYMILRRKSNFNLLSDSKFDVQNLHAIHKWLLASMLNNAYGGASDGVLRDTRQVIHDSLECDMVFPLVKLVDKLKTGPRRVSFDRVSSDNLLSLTYSNKLSFLALSILYENTAWGDIKYHKDHIFPQSLANVTELRKLNLSGGAEFYILNNIHTVANLQLLVDSENREKKNMDFSEWIRSRDARYCDKHFIPKNKELYRLENFEDFISERQKLISAHLRNLFSEAPND